MPPTPTVLIIGAGPAGMVLAHILARNNIHVTVLEMHADFDRDFRGDTIHASTMEALDQLGLADDLLKLPHEKMHQGSISTPTAQYNLARFSHLNTKFPYVTLMPQSEFLEFLDTRSAAYRGYTCIRNAAAQALLREGDKITGVTYRKDGEDHTRKAELVVAADGRFSRMRKLAGLQAESDDIPSDVAWCRVSPGDTDDHTPGGIHTHEGTIVVLLPRDDGIQLGCVFPKGEFTKLKEAGLESYQQRIAATVPELSDRVTEIDSWDKVHLLNIKSDCLSRWYLPGLMIIGDAAHTMSPVGGVGINCAIADAIATANSIIPALKAGELTPAHLQQIQQRRERPTRQVQGVQNFIQQRVIKQALNSSKPFKPPLIARIILKVPGLRNIPARFIAFGPQPEKLDPALIAQ